jgi:hypothetical protein
LRFSRESLELDDIVERVESLEQAAKIDQNKDHKTWASQAA